MKRVTIVYFEAGGGHRAAMEAISEAIRMQRRPWEITRVDFQQILQEHDPVQKLTGVSFADAYTQYVGTGLTFGATQGLKVLHGIIRLYHRKVVQSLTEYWRAHPADMVVSVIPNFNRELAESVRTALPDSAYVTVITDIADTPPHFWIERESEYVVCGSERAVAQAKKIGHADDHVFRTSGMVLHPRFYEPFERERAAERVRLGLKPDLPTGLVLFGGGGGPAMVEIAERLEHSRLELQMIFICGRNEKVAQKLRGRSSRYPFVVEGFTREVPYYMRLSDFFVGKPGPGSVSEALACGLPVIVESNMKTLPQERYNAEWVRNERLGVVVRSFGDINRAVGDVLSDPVFRQNAAQVRNRAVFEVPDIFQQILAVKSRADREVQHA
ncbi:MAG: glycosyltransferase [Terriglobales bacterium]